MLRSENATKKETLFEKFAKRGYPFNVQHKCILKINQISRYDNYDNLSSLQKLSTEFTVLVFLNSENSVPKMSCFIALNKMNTFLVTFLNMTNELPDKPGLLNA